MIERRTVGRPTGRSRIREVSVTRPRTGKCACSGNRWRVARSIALREERQLRSGYWTVTRPSHSLALPAEEAGRPPGRVAVKTIFELKNARTSSSSTIFENPGRNRSRVRDSCPALERRAPGASSRTFRFTQNVGQPRGVK